MSELVRHSLLVEQKQPLDEEQRAIFDSITRELPATYEQLSLPKEVSEELKQQFFASGRTINPNLTAKHLDQDRLAMHEARWLTFKQHILNSDVPPDIVQPYRWATNEAIANTRMAHFSALGDMRAFRSYNEFIHGDPDPEIFTATSDWFRYSAEQLSLDENPEVAEAAAAVLESVPDLGGNRRVLIPSEEVFRTIKEQYYKEGGYYALTLAGVNLPEGVKVPNEVGDPALLKVLSNIGSNYGIEDAAGSVWSADHYREAMLRPATYNMIYRRFLGLAIGHEAKHILERTNGLRQSLGLLGLGLDRSEKGNEGTAVIGEQVPYESFEKFAAQLRWQDIMRRHFAISLAEGLQGQEMDFSQVFDTINKIDRLWERSKKPDEIAAADAKADNRSWDLMVRIMRGTDGQGGAYLKDTSYLEGNVGAWRVAAINPGLIEASNYAKIDIANPRHIEVSRKFGALPTNQAAE